MQKKPLASFINRNISSFIYPEDLPEPTEESIRSHFFTRGVQIYYPRLDCPTCNQSYHKFNFHEDQEINTVECPGCHEQHIPTLTVQGLHSVLPNARGERRIMNRPLEEYSDKELTVLYQDCEVKHTFNERVDYLGLHQLRFRLAKLLLSQPLLLMTSMNLVKKQPTLAYNMRLTLGNFEDMMIEIFYVFIEQSKSEAFRTGGVKHSIADMLPVLACLPDEKSIDPQAEPMVLINPEEEKQIQYNKLITYVFRDRRKGEHAISLRTYNAEKDELIKDTQLEGLDAYSHDRLKENLIHYRTLFHCLPENHELAISHFFGFGDDIPFTRNLNLLQEDKPEHFGEPYNNEHLNCCHVCTAELILVIDNKKCIHCGVCGASIRHRPEIHLRLEPVNSHGYRYYIYTEVFERDPILRLKENENFPDLTPEDPIAFSDLSYQLGIIEAKLQEEKNYRLNPVNVYGPAMLNLYMPHSRWTYIPDCRLDYLKTPDLQDYIVQLKEDYVKYGKKEYEFYRAALDYQFPTQFTKNVTTEEQTGPTMDVAIQEALAKLSIINEEENREPEEEEEEKQ